MPNSSKKVCLVSISLAKGGAERSVALLTKMLTRNGHEVHLVVLNDEVDYDFSGTLFNLGKFKTSSDSLFKRLLRFRKLRKYLLKEKFDFIIDHRPKNDLRREQFYHKYIYKGIRKIYVVHTSHQSQWFKNHPNGLSELFQRNYATVAVSGYIEKEILQSNGITNTQTIYNTYDPKWQESNERLPENLENKQYILSYGRIDDQVKDYSFLIDAFALSNLWKENILLVIMGEGKDKPALQQKVSQMECKNQVLFLPFNNSPFSIIANSRFVSLTSRYEGFPMVLIESLSLGTPVVSLDILSGPSEVIVHQKNGLLVKEREVKNFASAMKSMFENEQLYQICKSNARESVQDFSMEQIAEQWHNLIDTL